MSGGSLAFVMDETENNSVDKDNNVIDVVEEAAEDEVKFEPSKVIRKMKNSKTHCVPKR